MIRVYGVLALVELVLLVYCFLDVIRTPDGATRNLPKTVWLLLVLFFPLVGGIAWLAVGRPQPQNLPYRGNRGIPPEYDRPGRATAHSPDDDAEFLEQLKRRAEEQRRRAAEEAKRLRDQEDQPPQA